jgi:hypothetical protein
MAFKAFLRIAALREAAPGRAESGFINGSFPRSVGDHRGRIGLGQKAGNPAGWRQEGKETERTTGRWLRPPWGARVAESSLHPQLIEQRTL